MTIRAKLAASIGVLLLVTTALLGAGVTLVSRSLYQRDAARQVEMIVNSAQRVAQDALLQKDDLLLVSYLNFLREQYPALAQVRVEWRQGERVRPLAVGQAPPHVFERSLQVSDPADASRRVSMTLALDQGVLRGEVESRQRQLVKILVAVAAATSLLGLIVSLWFSSSLTKPLGSMVKLASAISSGRLGGKIEWTFDDELGELAKVFNHMSARLEEFDETKKNFVFSVTHELRSPLGAIESFLHLIHAKLKATGALNGSAKECEEYLSRIQVNVQRLGGFINDLLDVAKIEKGKMECVLRPMDLRAVAVEVCQFFEAKARQQGVSLSQRLEAVPAVQGDPERLRQVLVNLVANALKFTPMGGSVAITAEQYREGSSRWVEVTVADTGRGMDAKDLARLFEAFTQGKNVAQGVAGTKGTGLGLYISKSIIEQHGGKIAAASVPGQGTKISFSLRLA